MFHTVPMQNLSQSSLGAPIIPFKAGGAGSKYDYRMSSSTMDTAQLHATSPLQEQQYLRDHDQLNAPSSPGYIPQPFDGHPSETSAPGTPYHGPAPGLGHENDPANAYVSPEHRI
jgi:hypothetical protein